MLDEEIAEEQAELSVLPPPPPPPPPRIPPFDLQLFAKQVRIASWDTQQLGSRNCGSAVSLVPLASASELKVKVQEFVARVVGVRPKDLTETWQSCADVPCANLFQNDVYHQDGRMGDALLPAAQRVDAEASDVQLKIFQPVVGGIAGRPVVVSAGIKNGWLMGVAFFSERTKCE
jgi:hypothetical protein